MKSLKEYISTGRKYIAVVYDDESQKKLKEWAEDNGFNLAVNFDDSPQKPEDFEFHTTIFYSTNEVNLEDKIIDLPEHSVSISGIENLGREHDVPVLILTVSGGIREIREHYMEYGLEDEWPFWKAHISLSYDKQGLDISKMKLPDFKPTFNKLKIRTIKD